MTVILCYFHSIIAKLRGCPHDWVSAGASYYDADRGVTLALRQCSNCRDTLIVPV